MRNVGTIIGLAITILTLTMPLQAQSFTLTGTQQINVTQTYDEGYLYDTSAARISTGGYVWWLKAYDMSMVDISGGHIGSLTGRGNSRIDLNSGGVVGGIDVWSHSTANIYWGSLVGGLLAYETSTVNIIGGMVEFTLDAFGESVINVVTGDLDGDWLAGYNDSSVNISGGVVMCPFFAYDSSTVNITGGWVDQYLAAYNNSRVDISGGNVNYLDVYNLRGDFGSRINITGGRVRVLEPFIAVVGNEHFSLAANLTLSDLAEYGVHAADGTVDNVNLGFQAYNTSTVAISSVGTAYEVQGLDASTVVMSGGNVSIIRAGHTSIVNVSGGSVNNLYASNASTVVVSGGSMDRLWAMGTSTVTLNGYDFSLGTGLSWGLDGQTIHGTGLLSGKWVGQAEPWTINIRTNASTATIRTQEVPSWTYDLVVHDNLTIHATPVGNGQLKIGYTAFNGYTPKGIAMSFTMPADNPLMSLPYIHPAFNYYPDWWLENTWWDIPDFGDGTPLGLPYMSGVCETPTSAFDVALGVFEPCWSCWGVYDMDENGDIDAIDVAIFSWHWLMEGEDIYGIGDFNQDGMVDMRDWELMMGHADSFSSLDNLITLQFTRDVTEEEIADALRWSILRGGYEPSHLHVAPAASGDGSGKNWANAMTLQNALQTARDRLKKTGEFTDIWLMAGTYKPVEGSSTFASFRLPSGVKLYAGFAGNESSPAQRDPENNLTILSGDIDSMYNSQTVVSVFDTPTEVLLDGLWVVNERPSNLSGYCILADGGKVKLNNCTLSYSGSGQSAAVIRADNSEIELAGTTLIQSQPTDALVRLMGSTLTMESGNSFSVGQFRLFDSIMTGQPLALNSGQSIIAETWPSGLGEPIADMYGGVIAPAAFYEPNEINFSSELYNLHLAGRTKTWVINPDALGAGTFTWTASRLDSDDSDESFAAGSFWADGEIEIHGPIYEINPDNPAHVTPVDTDGESLLLTASVGGFLLVEQEDNPDHFERLDVELIVTGGYLANNSELATRGRLTMSLWLGTTCHDDTSDLADFSRPIILTGDTSLSMTIAPTSMNVTHIQNTITGSGKMECQGASQLIVQNVNVSGDPDAEISVYGRLNVRGTLANTRISIFDAPVMQGDDLFYHDAGGRMVVGTNAQILNNRIVCEGDQFMLFESQMPNPAGISGNEITLIFHQGKEAQRGMLAEARSIDVDCGEGGANPMDVSGIFQVADDLSVRFSADAANNWLLERLELREGARLNLIDQVLSSDGDSTDAIYVRNLVLHPMSTLNLGYSKLYYETLWLADEEGIETECTEPITPGDHLFANGGRIINIPLLGYSLVVIHMDDQTLPVSKNEFGLRVSTRQKELADATGVGAVNLLMGHRGPGNGVMNMQTRRSMLSGSANSVAARGTFAPTASDEILVEFEYQFVHGYAEDAELVVYLSDSPILGQRLREIARIRPPADPARNGYGALHEDRFATFSGTFARQDLNFRAGSYIELELRGQDARVLIDNWDPQIRCSIVCGNYGAWPYSMATFHDYLLLLSEIGLVSPLARNKGCLDLRRDNIVDMEDVLAWELDGTTLCPAAASGLLGLMGSMGIKPIGSGFDPNEGGLVLFGRKEGDGVSNIMPANSFYGLDPNGLAHALQTAPAGGRLLTDRDGRLFQVRGKDGIYDVQTGAPIVLPAQFGAVKIAGVGNPITDAAFDPYDSDVLYVVPVLVNDAYIAAARLRLTGDGEYTIEQVYGGDPNSNPGQSITITDPNHTMSVLYEPDTQHVREIEVDAEGNVYALSSYSGNRNDWLLIYQANDPNNCDYINLTDAGIQSPSSMTVTSNGRLYLTPSVSRQDNASTVIYRIDISAASPAFLRTIEIVDCPTPPSYPGYHGLIDGEKAAITSMTEDRATGKLYAVGFTTPVFDPEVVWNPQTTPKKIFTTPFVVELDLATETPLVYPIVDTMPQRVALPISVAWKGTVSGTQDPCDGADIDGSGIVDLGDLVILASQWLQTPGIPSADIMPLGNRDNFVDMLDFQRLAEHWYKTGCNVD